MDRRGFLLAGSLALTAPGFSFGAKPGIATLDRQGPRGPLHGVPLLVKDNIETRDRLMTTAGSLALEGWYA